MARRGRCCRWRVKFSAKYNFAGSRAFPSATWERGKVIGESLDFAPKLAEAIRDGTARPVLPMAGEI